MSLRTSFDRMIAAREKQAARYVAGALLAMDEQTLREAGIDRASLSRKSHTYLPF